MLFYLVIFAMAASGMGMMVVSGAGPTILSGSPEPLPDLQQLMPRIPHNAGARVMVVLLFLSHWRRPLSPSYQKGWADLAHVVWP